MAKLPTQYQDFGDVKLAYCEHGDGPALILLHGNSESKAIFSKYQQVLFKDFRTIAVDSRGHGETISNDTSYSIKQYSEDVIRLCHAKGITHAAVIGYSDGGNIALFLASSEPKLFPKIVAISPNYLVSGTTDGALRFIIIGAKIFQVLDRLGLPTHNAVLRFNLMLTDIGLSGNDLTCIQTSMRILYAEHDLIKESHIQEIGRLAPGSTIKKVDHCNHLTILNNPEAIEDIRSYLVAKDIIG
jgi:pimeloyl-ACP methyl ester carboxylesterase